MQIRDRWQTRGALVALVLGLASGGALAQAGLGSPAPDFTLTGNDGASYTLSDVFGDQVQLLHMVGYAWGTCIDDGPGLEALYQQFAPDVRFMACDFWSGTDAQCDLYQDLADISFPVLLNALPLGAADMYNCSYHYVIVIDGDGIVQYRGTANMAVLEIVLQAAVDRLPGEVGVADTPDAARLLGANYPNPFNPVTRIPYEVPADRETANVLLEVLDVRGRLVRTLVQDSRPSGQHLAVFDGRDAAGNSLPSGSYVARLTVAGAVAARTMTLVK